MNEYGPASDPILLKASTSRCLLSVAPIFLVSDPSTDILCFWPFSDAMVTIGDANHVKMVQKM